MSKITFPYFGQMHTIEKFGNQDSGEVELDLEELELDQTDYDKILEENVPLQEEVDPVVNEILQEASQKINQETIQEIVQQNIQETIPVKSLDETLIVRSEQEILPEKIYANAIAETSLLSNVTSEMKTIQEATKVIAEIQPTLSQSLQQLAALASLTDVKTEINTIVEKEPEKTSDTSLYLSLSGGILLLMFTGFLLYYFVIRKKLLKKLVKKA